MQEKLEDTNGVIRRYQWGNQKPSIEKGQTILWPKENRQNDKQLSTKHYTETWIFSNSNPTKTGGEFRFSGSPNSSWSTSGILLTKQQAGHTIKH